MAERNPNVPSERRMEVEERTRFNEDEANRRYAENQAELKNTASKIPNQASALPTDEAESTLTASTKQENSD